MNNPHYRQAKRVRSWALSLKKALHMAWYGLFGVLLLVLLCNFWVMKQTTNANYYEIAKVPAKNVGLVLGTSKKLSNGKENLFFKYRIEAAARLYKEGKVKYLILSGNNDSPYYNEPADMKLALENLGVPENVMTLDFDGERTYDSILRCKEVFNQEEVTIISQSFHNVRALYLAQNYGIDAVAFSAQDAPRGYALKTIVREYLARPKAMLDVFWLHPPTSLSNNEIAPKTSIQPDSVSVPLPVRTPAR